MSRTLLFLFLLATTPLMAQEQATADDVKMNLLNATTNDDTANFQSTETERYLDAPEEKIQVQKPQTPINIEEFRDAILLNNIEAQATRKRVEPVQQKTSFYADADAKLQREQEELSEAIKEAQTTKEVTKLVRATCMAHQDLQISLKDFMKLTCKTEKDNKIIEAYGSFIADNENYALLGKIDYFVMDLSLIHI